MSEQLLDLIFERDINKIEKCIKEGTSPNAVVHLDRRALSMIAACGYIDQAEKLLELGADINLPNEGDLGYTPIIEAARDGQPEMVQFLFDNKANLESVDTREGTALIHSCISAHHEVLRLLIKLGADVNGKDVDHQTGVHYLCRYAKGWGSYTITQTIDGVETELENPRFQEHTDILTILLENGADVNAETTYGYTPLILAAESDAASFIPMLIEKGADVNWANSKGFSALMAATDRGNIDAVNMLLQHDADIMVVDNDGFTPVLGATMAGNVELLKLLLEKGAPKSIRAKVAYRQVEIGDNALSLAKKMERSDLIELLED